MCSLEGDIDQWWTGYYTSKRAEEFLKPISSEMITVFSLFSRFTKNLSPDKINLSTLKGEGQLTNLELDEDVLQNMLDLPTWLAINKVFCNKAAIRVGSN